MVGVSASVNLPLHCKVQKFSSGISSPRWSRKKAVKRLWCGVFYWWFTKCIVTWVVEVDNFVHFQHESISRGSLVKRAALIRYTQLLMQLFGVSFAEKSQVTRGHLSGLCVSLKDFFWPQSVLRLLKHELIQIPLTLKTVCSCRWRVLLVTTRRARFRRRSVFSSSASTVRCFFVVCHVFRVTTLPGKSRNLVRPFSRPGKSWKTAKVMESHGKWWWSPGVFFCKNALEFLFL